MDENTRRQITWILIIAAVLCLLIYGVGQSRAVPNAVGKLASGSLSEQLEAAQLLVERGKVAEALDKQPRWIQMAAVKTLLTLGSPSALQQLVEAIPKLDEPVAKWAGENLTSLGQLAIGPLVECIQNKNGAVRSAAEGPLAAIGGSEVAMALTPLIGAYDDYVRGSVTNILSKLPELAAPIAIPILLRNAPLPDQTSAAFARSQDCALNVVVAMGKDGLEPVLTNLVPSPEERVRATAALMLGRMVGGLKEEAGAAIAPLVRLSSDSSWAVRRRAAWALGELGQDGQRPEVLQALQQRLSDQPEVRSQAIKSLGQIGSPASVPSLVAVLVGSSREGVSSELVSALQAIGPPALPALSAALQAPEAAARALATQAVAAIATPAAAPLLAGRLGDGDVQVRRLAARALEILGTPGVVAPLARALQDPDAKVYASSQRALTSIGAPAVPALIASLGGDPRVSLLAQETLASIGAPAVPGLIGALRSGNAAAHMWAAVALGDIGAPAVEPASALALDAGALVASRAAAAAALGHTKLPVVVPTLKALVASANPELRIAALRAFADSQQPEATSYLVAGLKDPVAEVRMAALPLVEQWQAGDVDRQLTNLLAEGAEDTKRLAAIALAFHASPSGMQQLPGTVVGTPAMAGEGAGQVATILNAVASDLAVAPGLRRQAVIGLGYAGNAESVGALQRLLAPGNPLAAPAARSLGLLGQRLSAGREAQAATQAAAQAVTELLNAMLTTRDEQLRVHCAAALALAGEPAIKPLIAALDSAPPAQAPWLAATLGAIGKPILQEAMREANRKAASMEWVVVALSLTHSPDALNFLGQLTEEEQASPAALAAGESAYNRLMIVRRAPVSS